jgi:pimeloyl-ACP methyl ester carboxylesterase
MPLDTMTRPAPYDAVFIHGAGGTNLLWDGLFKSLAGDRTAFAVNLPGHPVGEITCTSIDDYAEAVLGFILDRGLRPAVCGHSMGGAVALTLALKHPDAVSALVLIGTGAKLGVLPEILSGLENEPLETVEARITPLSFYTLGLDVARKARSALSLSNPRIFLNDYLACGEFDLRGRLTSLSTNTLILCGENDQMTPPRWSHYLNDHIAPSRAFFVRESGHMLPLEKPDLSGRLIQDFLSELNR